MTESLQFSQALRGWIDIFAHRSMHSSARFIKASGISMPQFFLLMHLHRHEQCGISDLSEQMDVTTAAVSQLVDKLVQSGLLERIEDPNDRRAKQVSLAPAGKEFVEKAIAERTRWVDELANALSDDDKVRIAAALELLTEETKKLEIAEKV